MEAKESNKLSYGASELTYLSLIRKRVHKSTPGFYGISVLGLALSYPVLANEIYRSGGSFEGITGFPKLDECAEISFLWQAREA